MMKINELTTIFTIIILIGIMGLFDIFMEHGAWQDFIQSILRLVMFAVTVLRLHTLRWQKNRRDVYHERLGER